MPRGQGLPLDGARLRAARTAAGLSQRQLAERLPTTRQQVIRYEQGAERPEARRLAELARAIGVGVGDLVAEGSLPEGLAGLRIGAGLTLAAAAAAVRAQLPAGARIACSRPVLADAERGAVPPTWCPPVADIRVRSALGQAYGADPEAVRRAWSATFPEAAPVKDGDPLPEALHAPLPGERDRAERKPEPRFAADRPLCPYTPEELARVRVVREDPRDEHGLYRVESPTDHRVLGFLWHKAARRWAYAPADSTTGRPPERPPVVAAVPTRTAALERLLAQPGPLWGDPADAIVH
ncbi:helix-turn-helix domain-containing protein [Nocardiopsis sp. NPDC058631]|uniref:helix-turn-helix domain-containing protein n=1 Tax=Nocardiopsis sp. NPDC058631 TaxID=3346566 RepID=UPI003663396B